MRRFGGLVAVLAALALVGAACGTDDNSKSSTDTTSAAAAIACDPGTISGAGSTFVQNIAQQWIKDFGAKCPGATVNYQGVGSGAGIQQFTAGTVDFGASDTLMKPEEESAATAKGGAGNKVLQLPWTAGGIAVEYNLSGVSNLKLSGPTLAAIFAGKVKTWNDKMISDDGNANLPSTGIQVVHRSDGSGTTAAFTEYLKTVAPTVWTAGTGKDVPWPTGQGAKGSDGVTAAVKQTQGAIGYAEISFAKGANLGIASIKNEAGNYEVPDAKNVSAAIAEAVVPDDLKIKANYKPSGADAYPISTPSFVLLFQKPLDPAKGKVLKDFLLYATTSGQTSAEGLYYAPLPTELQNKVKAAVEGMQVG